MQAGCSQMSNTLNFFKQNFFVITPFIPTFFRYGLYNIICTFPCTKLSPSAEIPRNSHACSKGMIADIKNSQTSVALDTRMYRVDRCHAHTTMNVLSTRLCCGLQTAMGGQNFDVAINS